MKLNVNLNYPGHCEQAFRFYEQHLGARITMLQRHDSQPDVSQIPAGWSNAVMHARLELGDAVVLGSDTPRAEPMRSAYLTLTFDTAEETERVYALLSAEGKIFMEMEETFFAKRFAMLQDRFGTSWMLLCQPLEA